MASADTPTPVLRKLFEAPILRSPTQPLVVQFGKMRPNTSARGEPIGAISDSELSVRAAFGADSGPDPHGLKGGDILRVQSFEIIPNKDAPDDILPEFTIKAYEIIGPCDHIIGNIASLKNDVFVQIRRAARSRAAGGSAPSSSRKVKQPNDLVGIESVTGFMNKWRIRARVSDKSAVRTYHSARGGEGKLFNVTFVDETGEIRATAFTQEVDKFYDVLEEGRIYYVTKCRVQTANKQFNTTSHDFELLFTGDTEITPCEDSNVAAALPTISYNFAPHIRDLTQYQPNSNADVIGVIRTIGDSQQLTSKSTNRPYTKRDVDLVDESHVSVRVTLWGEEAEKFSAETGDVLAIKAAKVSDFDGRSLSTLRSSKIALNPEDDRRAHRLKGWWDAEGRSASYNSMRDETGGPGAGNATERTEEYKTVAQVHDELLGLHDQPDYYTLRGHIVRVFQRSIMYPACPREGCNKKLVDIGGGEWRCEKCDETVSEPQWRYILTLVLGDPTARDQGLTVSVFDEVGAKILGKSATEVSEMPDDNTSGPRKELLDSVQGEEYVWRIRAKQDNWGDQVRARHQALSATPTKQVAPKLAKDLLAEMGF